MVSKKRSTQPTTASLLVQTDQALPHNLFVLPIKEQTVFPTLVAPLAVSEKRYIETVEEAIHREKWLGILLQKKKRINRAVVMTPEYFYHFGVIVRILKRIKLPDGSIQILIHGIKRFQVKRFLSFDPHIIAHCQYLEDQTQADKETDALRRMVIQQVKKLSEMNPFFSEEMRLAMLNAPAPGVVADIVAFSLSLPAEGAQDFLKTLSVKQRFQKLLVFLKKEKDLADLQKKIQDDVNQKVNKMQREFFLKEQLKVIRKELGLEEDGKAKTMRLLEQKLKELPFSLEVKKVVQEELEKLKTLPEHAPEYHIVRSYLEMVAALPWGQETKDCFDLKRSKNILNRNHYGLNKVKERVLEFLSVRKLKAESPLKKRKSKKNQTEKEVSILCFVGPPGVGKTSIGKTIAAALGRKFYRFSLGGMRDEAEIKGHRRTYVGAMPGKILLGLKRTGSKNLVFMLDEVDKLSEGFQGDPASALLEALDPEQNVQFLDHYLDVPFDLSQVFFIATANTVATIPPALLNRMEVIELPGYTFYEKEKIIEKHLLPKVLRSHGFQKKAVKLSKKGIQKLIHAYAREPGVRIDQQMLEKIIRKLAYQKVKQDMKQVDSKQMVISEKDLKKFLGPERYDPELLERTQKPGVAIGLAWTGYGGAVLFIEGQKLPGSGELKLTGQLGEVMTESATLAWTFMKKKLLEEKVFLPEEVKKTDIHIHIPAGAIPKDGPSAGVTIGCVLYSLFTGKKVRPFLAMTGELSLLGKVWPVGGLQEKLLAAKRAGIKKVLLPFSNRKNLTEFSKEIFRGLRIEFVKTMEDVLEKAFKSTSGTNKRKKAPNK